MAGRADRKRVRKKLRKAKEELRATKHRAGTIEPRKRLKRQMPLQQEIFRLERKLCAIKDGTEGAESQTGALPDFVVIGTMRGGTSFFYYLLTQHPLVEPCATKELHFFDHLFDEGIEWYRQSFPAPRWEDERRTITGEATPYLDHPSAPERVAQVIPQARLIALLRNPVDRAYSNYQRGVRKGRETRTFEEAVGLREPAEAGKVQPLGKERENSESEGGTNLNDDCEYLSRSVYVDQLLRWAEFFPKEQMLVLKSEEFFEQPQETLGRVFKFLGLPEWEPGVSESAPKRGYEGEYDEEMDPSTRRRLEEYFEPNNKRLYEFLGTDLGW